MIIDFHTHIFDPNIIENKAGYLDDQAFSILYSSDKSKLNRPYEPYQDDERIRY